MQQGYGPSRRDDEIEIGNINSHFRFLNDHYIGNLILQSLVTKEVLCSTVTQQFLTMK